MVLNNDEDWFLPPVESINLTEEEFLLLDWCMGSASGLIPGATLDDLMERWASLRFDVWKSIHTLIADAPGGAVNSTSVLPLLMDEFTARVLLAVIQTTFRWGTGADCGFSLKLKLYRFLIGERDAEHTDTDETDSSTTDESQSASGPEA